MTPAAPAVTFAPIDTNPTSRFSKPQIAGLALCVAVIAWRVFQAPPSRLWRDWMLLLAVYGIGSIFASQKKAWTAVTVAFMAALMLLYWCGQLPLARWPSDPGP